MEQLKQFDKRFREQYSSQIILNRLGMALCFLLGVPMVIVVAVVHEPIRDYMELLVLPIFCMTVATCLYLLPYMGSTSNGKRISIYQLLLYTPVDPKSIVKSRSRLVLKFTGILTLILVGSSCLISLISYHKVESKTVILPIGLGMYLYLIGILYILPWSGMRQK